MPVWHHAELSLCKSLRLACAGWMHSGPVTYVVFRLLCTLLSLICELYVMSPFSQHRRSLCRAPRARSCFSHCFWGVSVACRTIFSSPVPWLWLHHARRAGVYGEGDLSPNKAYVYIMSIVFSTQGWAM